MSASITVTSASSSSFNWVARDVLRNLGASSHAAPKIGSVMIADEHGMVRDVLYRLIDAVPFVEIVAHAADGHDALQTCRAYRPDIVMMELQLPSLNGVDDPYYSPPLARDTHSRAVGSCGGDSGS
ncbi:response regulator [Paraburkholderia graminis]|uniref:PleD family two-component response regulator n=1 Tax=Paraburkholderia graminis TaxID=60548 RepID=A0ABD5CRY8_9BURK|nr:response regulator [Paraburkholderia graminis]MDR6208103.1 PleD family two-component response regulator [Paraburkholderia graminis]